jgi:uncharacterized protein YndB with AHSA1/START domain
VPAPFEFDRSWTFEVAPEALWAALTDVEQYPVWWPWLRRFEAGGDALTEGTVARCTVKAPLPYALDFTVAIVDVEPLRRVEALVDGDLRGPARLLVGPDREGARATLQWEVELRDRVLRTASRLARPLMEWGHDWVVDSGVRQFRAKAL